LPMDPNSQMLTFHMQHIPEEEEVADSAADLVTMTLRASGTEPKVKLYLECRSESQEMAQSLAGKAFEAVVCMWALKHGKQMKPASPKIKSSSGVMHDICTDSA
jgi:phosphoglucomutase